MGLFVFLFLGGDFNGCFDLFVCAATCFDLVSVEDEIRLTTSLKEINEVTNIFGDGVQS